LASSSRSCLPRRWWRWSSRLTMWSHRPSTDEGSLRRGSLLGNNLSVGSITDVLTPSWCLFFIWSSFIQEGHKLWDVEDTCFMLRLLSSPRSAPEGLMRIRLGRVHAGRAILQCCRPKEPLQMLYGRFKFMLIFIGLFQTMVVLVNLSFVGFVTPWLLLWRYYNRLFHGSLD
jgi:hypothetical protein